MSTDNWIDWLPELLEGLLVSLQLTGAALVLGLPFGIGLALLSSSKFRAVRCAVIAAVDIFRGIPLLVLLYLVYFGLPSSGVTLTAMTSAIAALALNTAAYTSEIFRAGILNVSRGQTEAGASLGLTSGQVTRRVVLPQALRTVTAPIMSHSILVFHGTSLASVIAVSELTQRAFFIGSTTFEYFSVLLLAGLIYAAISIALSQVVHHYQGRNQHST